MLRRALIFWVVTALSVALDQLSKQWAIATIKGHPTESFLGDTFRWTFATNEGAFLSLGASLPDGARYLVLTVAVGLLLLGITIYTHVSKKVTIVDVAGYALIVSGGGSNWFDRARFGGSVVDFMNVGIGQTLRSGIFNVADLAIIAGLVVLFFASRQKDKEAAAQKAAAAAQPPAAAT